MYSWNCHTAPNHYNSPIMHYKFFMENLGFRTSSFFLQTPIRPFTLKILNLHSFEKITGFRKACQNFQAKSSFFSVNRRDVRFSPCRSWSKLNIINGTVDSLFVLYLTITLFQIFCYFYSSNWGIFRTIKYYYSNIATVDLFELYLQSSFFSFCLLTNYFFFI